MHTTEDAAFTRLYLEHADRVHAYLRIRLAQPANAEDLTAQVFLEAWRQRDRVTIDPELGWAPWLFGVARNLVRETARHSSRYSVADIDSDSPAWGLAPDPAVSHSEREERQRVLDAALAAIRQLGDADREVIELCVIGSLTPQQAAAVLSQPAPTVRSRLSRARHRLRAFTHQTLNSQEVLS